MFLSGHNKRLCIHTYDTSHLNTENLRRAVARVERHVRDVSMNTRTTVPRRPHSTHCVRSADTGGQVVRQIRPKSKSCFLFHCSFTNRLQRETSEARVCDTITMCIGHDLSTQTSTNTTTMGASVRLRHYADTDHYYYISMR